MHYNKGKISPCSKLPTIKNGKQMTEEVGKSHSR